MKRLPRDRLLPAAFVGGRPLTRDIGAADRFLIMDAVPHGAGLLIAVFATRTDAKDLTAKALDQGSLIQAVGDQRPRKHAAPAARAQGA
jgi:hypothetical protein